MNIQREINKKLLRECVAVMGLEGLAVAASCSASLLQKLCGDSYTTVPSLKKCDALCAATGQKMDALFPIVQGKKKSVA
jgi:hypothetical protein